MAERLFYCGVCQVRLSGPAPARQHYESQKHLKKEEVAKLMSISSVSGSKYYCKVCNIACDTEMMLKIHEQSDRHQQVLKMADHLFPDVVQVSRGLEAICLEKKHGFDENAATAHSPVPEVGRTVQPVEEKYYEFFGDRGKCYACQIELTSRKHAEQHLTGQKHQKAVKVALAQKQFYGVTSLPHREHAPSSICSYSSSNHQVTSGQFTGDQSTGHLYSDGAVPERQFPLSGNSSLCLNLRESSIPGSSMSLQKPALSSFCQENVESNQLLSTTSSSYDCNVCNKKMPSLEQLHLHNESAVHLRKAERFRSPQLSIDNTVWLPCHHCGKPLNSVKSLRAHFADAHLMTETQINDFFDEQRRKEVDEQQQPLDLRSGAAGERYVTMAQSVAETIPKCIGGRLLSEVNVAPVGLTKSGFSPNKDSNQGSQLSSSPPRPSFPNVRPAIDSREWSKPERQFPLESGAGILGPCGKQSCMFHCDVCSLCLNSVRQREDHMVGSSHVKKLLNTSNCTPSPRNGKFYCALCDSFMNTQKDYNIHLGGQQHTLKAAKKVPAPERDLGPVSKSLDSNACRGMSYKLTVSSPRSYQMELYTKAMEADTVCFLPTGTGKTLVSIMVMSHMLRLHPRRPAVFLVDKILLVLQQSEEIRKEIGDQLFPRWNTSTEELEERKLRIAELCSGKQNLNESEVWQQDVVVITAAYYNNLLESGSLRFADNCLVVFDEVHHCVKQHPYRVILEKAGLSHPDPLQRPKILGLTASPAGKNTIKGTVEMLQGLLSRLGEKVKLITVEEPATLAELQKYQSNTELVVREVEHSTEEVHFRDALRRYLLECLLRLKMTVQLPDGDEFDMIFNNLKKENAEDHLSSLTVDTASRLSDKLALVTVAERNVEFKTLKSHMEVLCQALIAHETLGMMAACFELSLLWNDTYFGGFSKVAQLDLPYEKLADLTKSFLTNHREEERIYDVENLNKDPDRDDLVPVFRLLVKEIVERLNNKAPEETKREDKEKPLVLVLVRRRKDAQALTKLLKNSRSLKEHGMAVTYVVGHGTGKDGMPVGAQERVLNDIREHKYQVIVATSVAEEGLDFPLCELVVQLNPPDTVRALVQIRGRARKKGSRFVAFCQTPEQKKSFDELREQEEHMIEAVKQLTTTNPDTSSS